MIDNNAKNRDMGIKNRILGYFRLQSNTGSMILALLDLHPFAPVVHLAIFFMEFVPE